MVVLEPGSKWKKCNKFLHCGMRADICAPTVLCAPTVYSTPYCTLTATKLLKGF